MKRRLKLLMLIGSCAAVLLMVPSANTVSTQATSRALRSKLQLTTVVLQKRSCSADELGLKLRLRIRNVSQTAVILHKQTDIYRIMVSANAAGAKQKEYEQNLKYDDPGANIGLGPPVLSDFTILEPDSVLEFERTVSVYLFNPGRPTERLLKPGSHLLQVNVGSWPYTTNPQAYQQQWRDHGYLFSEGLTSDPMPFAIEKDNPVVNCTGG